MAGGRDLRPRSPRWLNGLIWSSGLGAAAYFIWRALACDAEPHCSPIGLSVVLSRAVSVLMLPVLIGAALVARAVRWVVE
jgi:hypothetical protein